MRALWNSQSENWGQNCTTSFDSSPLVIEYVAEHIKTSTTPNEMRLTCDWHSQDCVRQWILWYKWNPKYWSFVFWVVPRSSTTGSETFSYAHLPEIFPFEKTLISRTVLCGDHYSWEDTNQWGWSSRPIWPRCVRNNE